MLTLINNLRNENSDHSKNYFTHTVLKKKVYDNIKCRKGQATKAIFDTPAECLNSCNNFGQQSSLHSTIEHA